MYENGTNLGNEPECRECEAYEKENESLRERVTQLELENKRLHGLYGELLYQVEMKYPGESRHETAKRMLHAQQPSQQPCGPAQTANK